MASATATVADTEPPGELMSSLIGRRGSSYVWNRRCEMT
jgi:hypothetical protein